MMGSKPLVSIGMPVYNGERYIRQALDSLLAQDYENFELIISDNASTDATQEICLGYASSDKRIRYHRNVSNIGMVENFNHVFRLSSGKYFMWAAFDDLWDQAYIRKCLEVLERHPSAVLCCSELTFIDDQGRDIPWSYDNLGTLGIDLRGRVRALASLSMGWYALYGLIRPEALARTNLCRNVYGPDVVLLMELSLLGPFAKVPERLFYYRFFMSKTEKSIMDQLHPGNNGISLDRPYAALCGELLNTISSSDLPGLTKSMLYVELLTAIYFHNSGLRNRLRTENEIMLRRYFREGNIKKTSYHLAWHLILDLPFTLRRNLLRFCKGIFTFTDTAKGGL